MVLLDTRSGMPHLYQDPGFSKLSSGTEASVGWLRCARPNKASIQACGTTGNLNRLTCFLVLDGFGSLVLNHPTSPALPSFIFDKDFVRNPTMCVEPSERHQMARA